MAPVLLQYESPPSYAEFARDCLAPNRPALLPASATAHWNARIEWGLGLDASPAAGAGATSAGDDLHPLFAVLAAKYGDHQVPVVAQARDLSAEERSTRTLHEAVELMRSSAGDRVHYVKDWHLFRQEDTLRGRADTASDLYEVLSCFQDDWMNHADVIRGRDDFRFCYAGEAGTQTPLHADVYQSYSWSTNLVGVKRWRMFPPHTTRFMRQMDKPANDNTPEEERDARTSLLARTVEEMDQWASDGRLGTYFAPLEEDGHAGWPRWSLARDEMIEFTSSPGETVFVPSGWVHEVLNLTSCVSINHNWCNAYNIPALYRALGDEVDDIARSMDDVRQMLSESRDPSWLAEWTQIVQSVAKADLGWDWDGFWTMVYFNLRGGHQGQNKPNAESMVLPRIRDLLSSFAGRDEAPHLPPATLEVVAQCQQLVGFPLPSTGSS